MKTTLYTTALIFLFSVLSLNIQAKGFDFEDEDYIDDIPFETEVICEQVTTKTLIVQFDFEDEGYIDDIPFITSTSNAQINYAKALEQEFDFADEEYIDDIPFSTETLVKLMDSTDNPYSSQFSMANTENYLF